MYNAFQYVVTNVGVDTASGYPYQGKVYMLHHLCHAEYYGNSFNTVLCLHFSKRPAVTVKQTLVLQCLGQS